MHFNCMWYGSNEVLARSLHWYEITIVLFAGDYDLNKCLGPHCKPCLDRYPSCSGKPDGLNPFPGRELTGYYIVCENDRYTETGICIVDKILDPTRRVCADPGDRGELLWSFCNNCFSQHDEFWHFLHWRAVTFQIGFLIHDAKQCHHGSSKRY